MATAEEVQRQFDTYSPQRMEDVYREMWQGADEYNKKIQSGSKSEHSSGETFDSDAGKGKR